MKREILNPDELNAALEPLNDWAVNDKTIIKQLKFENFATALEFVNKVGAIAERHDHHPDITFGWGYAEISLTTHDSGGITASDITVAKEIDEI